MLKVLMEKNKEIASLKEQLSKAHSDAGWQAEFFRNLPIGTPERDYQ